MDNQWLNQKKAGRRSQLEHPAFQARKKSKLMQLVIFRSGHGVRTAYEDVERAMPIVGS